jgi:predicted nucleic acid-binding protein
MIVVDASVAVKWLIPEAGEEAAKRLLAGRHQLIAPSLIQIEVTAAILRAFRVDRLPEERARRAIGEWRQMLHDGILHLVPDGELFASAVNLGFASRHAFQDCLYLAAAQSTKAKLITADRNLFERGGKSVEGVTFLDGV